MKNQTVLVTGASGSVGTFVVQQLIKDGYSVIGVDLPGSKFPVGNGNLTIKAGDLTDPVFYESFDDHLDYIIHTAAVVEIMLPFSALEPINTTAVKNLFQMAKRLGVKRFVHFSSGSIYKSDAVSPIKEETGLEAANGYAKSKIMAEEYLQEQRGSDDPQWVMLRPALIYGPKGKVLMASMAGVAPLISEFSSWLPGLAGGPETNMVHAEDVAAAAVHLMKKEGVEHQIFNVADDDPMSFTEFFNVTFELYGLKLVRPFIPLPPVWILKGIVPYIARDEFFTILNGSVKILWKWIVKKYNLEDELVIKLDKEAMDFATRDVVFDNSKLKATGFQLKFPTFRAGWMDTVQWYIDQRWIPPMPRASH